MVISPTSTMTPTIRSLVKEQQKLARALAETIKRETQKHKLLTSDNQLRKDVSVNDLLRIYQEINLYSKQTKKIQEIHRLFLKQIKDLDPKQNKQWGETLCAFADHDAAHIKQGFSSALFSLIRQSADKKSIASQDKTILSRFLQDPLSPLFFSLYPYEMLEQMSQQFRHQPTEQEQIDITKIVQNCWQSLTDRAIYSNIDWQLAEFSQERATDPNFTGILTSIEEGLELTTVKPYLISIIYNLFKNPLKHFVLEPGDKGQMSEGLKIIISAKKTSRAVVLEIIDNAPGFDLTMIMNQLPDFLGRHSIDNLSISQNAKEELSRWQQSPYATSISLTTILNLMFMYRLSGQRRKEGESINSGLGLWGVNNLTRQITGEHLVGINSPGQPPFSQGARFMLILPKHPHSWIPNLSTMAANTEFGTGVPWFRGD